MFIGYLDQRWEQGKAAGIEFVASGEPQFGEIKVLETLVDPRAALRRVEVVNGCDKPPLYLKGWFHAWRSDGNAMVEMEDGEVRVVAAGWMRFVVEKTVLSGGAAAPASAERVG